MGGQTDQRLCSVSISEVYLALISIFTSTFIVGMATSKSTDLNYVYLQTYLRLKLSITGLLLKNMNLTIQSIQLALRDYQQIF